MSVEQYQMPLIGQGLIFFDIKSDQRLEVVRSSLIDLGATSSTDRTLVFSAKKIELEEVVQAVDSLDEGDCVTVVCEKGGQLMSLFIVPPKLKGGVSVG